MSTGIKIKGGGGHTLSWNLDVGSDVGIDVEDSWNNLLEGNIHVSKKTMQVYGENFFDVLVMVQHSKDHEALLALGNILNSNPDNAVVGWEVLIKKFGTQIGNFSVSILANIISNPAYAMLKNALTAHGITLP